jgi:hypothetical protein
MIIVVIEKFILLNKVRKSRMKKKLQSGNVVDSIEV